MTALREKYRALRDEIYAELDKFFGEQYEGDCLEKERPENLRYYFTETAPHSLKVEESPELLEELIRSKHTERGFDDPYDLPDGLAVKIRELSDLHDALLNDTIIDKVINNFCSELRTVSLVEENKL